MVAMNLGGSVLPPRDPGALCILVVDGSPEFAIALCDALKGVTIAKTDWLVGRDSFSVTRVRRLDAALRELQKWTYDVVLLDLSLSDGAGDLVIQWGSSFAAEMPVIALGGETDLHFSQSVITAGLQGFWNRDQIDSGSLPGFLLAAVRHHALMRSPCAGVDADELGSGIEEGINP